MEFLVPTIQVLLHFKLHPSQDIWIRPRHCFALMLSGKLGNGLSRSLIRHVLHFSAGQGLVLTLHNNVGNNSKEGKCHRLCQSRKGPREPWQTQWSRSSYAFSLISWWLILFWSWASRCTKFSSVLPHMTDNQPTSTRAMSPLEVRGALSRFFWCPPVLTTS